MNFKAYAILIALGTATNATPGVAKAASSLGFQLGAAPRQGKRIKYKKGFLRRLQGKEPDYCDETKKPRFQAKGSPTKGECMNTVKGQTYLPQDFKNTNGDPISNDVTHYECKSEGKRIIVSNGIPDHKHVQGNKNSPCEMYWYVELPLEPEKQDSITELEHKGMIAMAINGVPAYGAMEAEDGNALDPNGNFVDASFWYGHATMSNVDHYHNPQMGKETVDDEVLLGFALDGFKIYGYTNNKKTKKLDECNGRKVNGEYRYYVRKVDDDIGFPEEYCDDSSGTNDGSTNWRYILGCYHGDVTKTKYGSQEDFGDIPAGCVAVDPTCSNVAGKHKFKVVNKKGKNKVKKKDCSWVEDDTEERCNLKIKKGNGKKAKHVCPIVCNQC